MVISSTQNELQRLDEKLRHPPTVEAQTAPTKETLRNYMTVVWRIVLLYAILFAFSNDAPSQTFTPVAKRRAAGRRELNTCSRHTFCVQLNSDAG
jgi:hypothetical protein